MNDRVLIADDEPLILDALRRQLRKKVTVETVSSGPEGLALIEKSAPFAVVLSDMRMPEMSGAAFLEQVRKTSPDSVRMILSGQAELESTIAAVNIGRIFRFLTKPCRAEELFAALESGIEQYHLIIARRELLEKTLHGTVEMLTEILGLTNPTAQKRANRIAQHAQAICGGLGVPVEWQLRIAVMLSQIGCISLPEEIFARIHAGQTLSEEAQSIYSSHPALAGKLLGSIPRLESVAEIVSHQLDALDVMDQPEEFRDWETTKFGAMVLKISTELDDLLSAGAELDEAVATLSKRSPQLPKALMSVLKALNVARGKAERVLATVSQLRTGMVLDEDVMSTNGLRLVSKGHSITRPILLRLQAFADDVGVVQPIRVALEE